MIETGPHTHGSVLAVHISQLTRPNLATLAQQGYGILPDQSGWLIFVRAPVVEAAEEATDPRSASSAPKDKDKDDDEAPKGSGR